VRGGVVFLVDFVGAWLEIELILFREYWIVWVSYISYFTYYDIFFEQEIAAAKAKLPALPVPSK
jgi:hypothetical protein